jgi:indolepyruvate ferredoxin oxidoreductase beta subunit
MKKDIILAGVGGQGVLSIAVIIARAAVAEGLAVRQSEVHGMAQRGGAVLAHLRIADGIIPSDMVPQGGADLIISMEALESLRYAGWLSPQGALVSAAEPFINIPDYPDIAGITRVIERFPVYRLLKAVSLAREAGHPQSVNMVMVGAASPFLPIAPRALENTIGDIFGAKNPALADVNLRAFRLGREAAAGHGNAE